MTANDGIDVYCRDGDRSASGMEFQDGDQGRRRTSLLTTVALVLGWAWALLAGGSGLYLLVTRGPWPLTNGWFALASGVSACPLTGWLLNRYRGLKVSGWVQFGAALFFFAAGRLALTLGLDPTR